MPRRVGDVDEGDLAAVVGLGDIKVHEDAQAGGVYLLEGRAVHDEEVSVAGLQLRLKSEDVAQGERTVEGENGAARICSGAEGVVELILAPPKNRNFAGN